MAASLNPFLAEDDLIENEIVEDVPPSETLTHNDSREVSPDSIIDPKALTLDHIATKLLRDNFVLTALEFHTELIESGRELPRLRDFFSNPANFERTKLDTSPPGLPRTSSVQTFDSLDFARYSDDGNQQENEKVAVLEFELRKAQDTIKSLRATLTRTAETELSSPDTPADGNGDLLEEDAMQPYEKRAINFLVNEYLLVHNYKLTSVTYAEENENQDFEDWDDVGLNMPKPPDLLHLFRNYGQHAIPITETEDKGVLVDFDSVQVEDTLQEMEHLRLELNGRISVLDDQVQTLSTENEFLSHQLKQLERETEAVRALKQKTSTPAVSPIPTPSKLVSPAKPGPHHLTTLGVGMDREDGDGDSIHEELGVKPLQEPNKAEGSGDSTDANLKDSNDTADTDMDGTEPLRLGSDFHSHTDVDGRVNGTETVDSMKVEPGTDIPSQDSLQTFQTNQSIEQETDVLKRSNNWQTSKRKVCETFQKALLSTTFQVSQDNRIVSEVSKISDTNREKVMLMLGRCLPHIVPNVLLAKREELIPLIICAATLHPEAKERDALLNILFNLIKKPDADQRQMILTGCVAFAQHVGPERVESELLPQCWEQITHRFPERRLLVAEACGALAPYLPNEILSSLVLSMLQQMLDDDKEEEVREAVTRSLGLLMGFIDDSDKYIKGSELLTKALNDPSERVLAVVQSVFLPAFAMWALELGRLETNLIQSFVDKLEYLVRGPQSAQASPAISSVQIDRQRFCLLATTLQQLIPILFASVIMSSPFVDKHISTEEAQVITLSSRFLLANSELTDLSVVVGSPEELVRLVCLYESYISEEWYEPWETFNWVAGELIPQLLNLTNSLDVCTPGIVHSMARFQYVLSRTFGRTFTLTKVRPKFQTVLRVAEEDIDTLVASNQTALTKCTVPVYVAGVLGAFALEEDCKELHTFLLDLLCTLSLCQAPLQSLKAAFSELCLNSTHHELLLTVLWEGVVHTAALVRSAAATMFELLIKGVNDTLVGTRVVPALVTLASDPEITVRISTVPAFGTILENATTRAMLDKVYMQFQTFMDDPIYKDQHALHVTLIKTFARVGPNAEPKFRDEFVLPRLAVMSATNNHVSQESQKMDIALSLFEAYSALSCCFISERLMQETMVPGLRCLLVDLQQVAPDHVNVVVSMIKELEDKMDASALSDRSLTSSTGGGTPSQSTQAEPKNKVLSRFKDMKDRASTSSNFQKIFGKKS